MEKNLLSYIEAMYESSSIITKENPDFLIVPMTGSVPFIDVMAIIDSNFDYSKAVYMPASSRIENINPVISNWYYNFLDENIKEHYQYPKVLGIDEVVSGNSVIRCFKNVDSGCKRKKEEITKDICAKLTSSNQLESLSALKEVEIITNGEYMIDLGIVGNKIRNGGYGANMEGARDDLKYIRKLFRTTLNEKLMYKTIGIEDAKLSDDKRNASYKKAKAEGRIKPVDIKSITTMDNPQLSSINFKKLKNPAKQNSYVVYSPEVENIIVRPEYLEFLQAVAKYVGKDPLKVGPVNFGAIYETSSKYLKKN